jgi:hypothetical protein
MLLPKDQSIKIEYGSGEENLRVQMKIGREMPCVMGEERALLEIRFSDFLKSISTREK